MSVNRDGGLPAPRTPRGYLGQDKGGPGAQGPVIQGWCPGALRPMLSGDGLVVRVRVPMGRLLPEQAAGIAALAAAHGSGVLDLSARANLQLRGVTEAGHGPLIDGLRGLGLIDADVAAETRRNVILQPFWQPGDASAQVAQDLLARLAAPDAPDLPAKFGFAVDCGARRVLEDVACDIRIERQDDALLLRPDGSALARVVTVENAAAAALDLARWFLASGGVQAGRGRMAALLARGTLPPGLDVPTSPAPFTARPGPAPGGLLAGFAFGQLDADLLMALARLGPLRLTPWRMLLIEGLAAAPALPGLITDPADPLLRVVACTGAPGCLQALQPTRDLARALAPHVTGLTHISGCAKGCAHPGPAPVTLTAMPAGFALIRQGTAASPALSHHSAAEILARPELLRP